MKKPHVLNRPMFNTGGTSAYGKGITSNLVSDEQRQRFNDGGRVRAAQGWPRDYNWYTGPYNQQYVTDYIPQTPTALRTFEARSKWTVPTVADLEAEVEAEALAPGLTRDKLGGPGSVFSQIGPDQIPKQFIETEAGQEQLLAKKMAKRNERINKMKEVGLVVPGEGHPSEGVDARWSAPEKIEDTESLEEVGVGEEEPSWAGIPGEGDPLRADTIIKEDTDVLDTPDKWAFLDENIAKKRKLARGHALMEGAAAAADWGTAGTAKEKGAAISKGLRGVGTIGAKYKGEAEDIKTKAKILGTVEEIKGEQKRKEWEIKMEGWYTPSLEQAKEAQEWKEGRAVIADALAQDRSGKEIYANILQPKEIRTPKDQQQAILSLTNQRLTIEDEKNSKQLRAPEKNGLIFINKLGEIVKNNNGSIDPINPLTDPFFTWKD